MVAEEHKEAEAVLFIMEDMVVEVQLVNRVVANMHMVDPKLLVELLVHHLVLIMQIIEPMDHLD